MEPSSGVDITLSDSNVITDIFFQHGVPAQIDEKTTLNFLSVVNVDEIPLRLVLGGQHLVTTTNAETERWFSDILLHDRPELGSAQNQPWWGGARVTSPLGILLAVTRSGSGTEAHFPRVTELLLYASRHPAHDHGPIASAQAPSWRTDPDLTKHQQLCVYALPLSSDLLQTGSGPSPPTSPALHSASDTPLEGVLLPALTAPASEVINEPPVRKRKDLNNTFDEADERRKRARRHGGESVAAAAASNQGVTLPSLKHRRSTSAVNSQAVPVQTRPLSRSPSISSSRPGTARAASTVPHRSSLSHVETAVDVAGGGSSETKNKDLISRIVMAGMRLYGLSQSKGRKAQPASGTASPAIDVSFEDHDETKRRDEEYKLVYHQVFKGVCFTFRKHMASATLQAHTEALRDAVDRLLALFCNDPLLGGLPGVSDELTPGGRKAFGVGTRSDVDLVALMPAG